MSDGRGCCYGNTSEGGIIRVHGCRRPPRFLVERASGHRDDGSIRYKSWSACGRHVAWVLDYVTVPGSVVRVTKLPKREEATP